MDFHYLRSRDPRTALVEDGARHSYRELDERIGRFASALLGGRGDLREERVACLLPASLDYVTWLHGVWRAGGIAVPLHPRAAISELERFLRDAQVTRLFAAEPAPGALRELCARLGVELLAVARALAERGGEQPAIDPRRRAMLVFTSGTTGRPKGVVSTHRAIRTQIATLVDAWRWTRADSIPLFLPLHHVHGIVNVLGCGLWAGARVHLFDSFDLPRLTAEVAAGTYSLFMAVPTHYLRLVERLEGLERAEADAIRAGFRGMRLNVSGSAACPATLFARWRELTGQALLERYGMTEIGMALSNPYRGERRAGHVGQALPGVTARLFAEDGRPLAGEGVPGELRVKGECLFLEYWNEPQATAASFVDGWFRTGDMAVLEGGYYRILGRSSVDIIKSGGYKLSALEIEDALLGHPDIAEVAVVGVADPLWGEAATAFIVPRRGARLERAELKAWCAGRLSHYKIPRRFRFLDSLPRNAMGKVAKPALKSLPA